MSFVTKENGDQKLRSAEWAGLVLCCHFVLASLHRLRHMLLPPPIMPSCDISITQSTDDHTKVIYEYYKLGATTKTADWWLISTVLTSMKPFHCRNMSQFCTFLDLFHGQNHCWSSYLSLGKPSMSHYITVWCALSFGTNSLAQSCLTSVAFSIFLFYVWISYQNVYFLFFLTYFVMPLYYLLTNFLYKIYLAYYQL